MNFEATCELLRNRVGPDSISTTVFRDNHRVHTAPANLFAVLRCLKEEGGFDQLTEVTAVDYLKYPGAKDRFGVVYVLTNIADGHRVVVKTMLNEPDLVLPSAFPLWKGADWLEREVYDMYGIVFEGHPDLRRILLPEEYVSYPLRKDYPLRGKGERHNFPVLTRAES